MSMEFPVRVGFEFLCLDIFGLVYLPDRCSHGFPSKEHFIVCFRSPSPAPCEHHIIILKCLDSRAVLICVLS